MTMTVGLVLILLVAGFGAGLLTTIAGVASLVSYPVLLSLGVPPVSANVTNTAALIFSGTGATLASRRELRYDRPMTRKVALDALLGGLAGSLLLGLAPASVFEHIVPFLILLAAILMAISTHRGVSTATPAPWVGKARYVGIFFVGLYIGYFGASAGVIFLAIMQAAFRTPFAVSNAIKNFACLLTNIMSLVIYAFTTKVYWLVAIVMGLGFFAGGLLGPVVIRHLPVRPLQYFVTAAAFLMAAYFFYDIYLK